MKKHKLIFSLVLAVCLILGTTSGVYANSYPTKDTNWKVTFTNEDEMEQNFSASSFADNLQGFQPGDTATFKVKVQNNNKAQTEWYMENEVINSLEDLSKNSETGGGAYTYALSYKGSNGKDVEFYNSEDKTAGGNPLIGGEDFNKDAGEGLHQATQGLEDWFYMDTLKKGESGVVTLSIKFDGESQVNDYQDTFAAVNMNFAVEKTPTVPDEPGDIVKTGDASHMILWAIVGLAAILLGLFVLIAGRRKEEQENE